MLRERIIRLKEIVEGNKESFEHLVDSGYFSKEEIDDMKFLKIIENK